MNKKGCVHYMLSTVKSKLKEKRITIINYQLRKRLVNQDFTIISNNCWGGQVYQDLGIEYKTPFAGLFIFAPDYIKLLSNFEFFMNSPLEFSKTSKYVKNANYPVGLLNGEVEIHFLHYEDEVEALSKWNRRTERINWGNLFFKFCDRDLCTKDLLIEFDRLPLKNKVCFTAQKHSDLKHSVWFSEHNNQEFVEPELKTYKKYFDVVTWLNTGKIVKK